MNTTVTVAGTEYTCIREGLADILGPKTDPTAEVKKTRSGGEEQTVFYNPIQAFNRDLSVLATKVFAEEVIATRSRKKSNNPSKGAKNNRNKRKRNDDIEASTTASVPEAKKPKTVEDEAAPNGKVSSGDDQVNGAMEEFTATQTGQPANTEKDHPRPLKPHFRILDALSATGLRALRYAKEIPEADLITANDLSAEAVASIKRNIEYNGVESTVHAIHGNAAGHMYHIGSSHSPILPDGSFGRYDVIDLDPYGTAAPFLDAAVQAVAADGGMLAVTCTDSAVFASVGYLEKTYAQYGGLPWKGSQSHEAGLRLIIHAIATSAARYGLAIEPLLSLSIDYYVRVFVRVRKSPKEVKFLPGKTMTVFNCDIGCGAWTKQNHIRSVSRENKNGEEFYHFTAGQGPVTVPNCEHCGFRTHITGPMWGGYLHNPDFIQRLLDKLPTLDTEVYTTKKRLEGILDTALNETLLPVEAPSEKAAENNGDRNENDTPSGAKADEVALEEGSQRIQPFKRLNPASSEDHPFFFIPSELAKVLKTTSPSEAALRGALIGLGYHVTRSHCKPNSIRTDAPWSVIWEIMRAWARQKGKADPGKLKESTPGTGIWKSETPKEVRQLRKSLESLLGNEQKVKTALAMIDAMTDHSKAENDVAGTKSNHHESEEKEKQATAQASNAAVVKDESEQMEPKLVQSHHLATSSTGNKMPVIFDEKLGRDPDKGRFVRYQVNPRENWGPQSRAK